VKHKVNGEDAGAADKITFGTHVGTATVEVSITLFD
jgi:hypothetical protein